MNIESVTLGGAQLQPRPSAAEKVDEQRRESKSAKEAGAAHAEKKAAKLAKEEILETIQALTEDGLYSVRFEKHKATHDLIIKLVDDQGEVIRQIPAEEVLSLSQRLQELRGNVIKAET